MANVPPRRLRKSLQERVLFGVCGGLADYLDVDVALVRVAFVLLAFVGGLGIIAYIALALFMGEPVTTAGNGPPAEAAGQAPLGQEATSRRWSSRRGRSVVGVLLIALGGLLLLKQLGLLDWLDWGTLWPIVLILIGIALVTRRLGGD
ncbi:MAG: PspC domain-containing protein [Chloroflexi bacterium]|nr:PspC domain-containing protein [Chloroflexota bacterium]